MTEFGTFHTAILACTGCERTVTLTSTSTFGRVYDARPRTVVWNGPSFLQLRWSGLSPGGPVGRLAVGLWVKPPVAHALRTDRPVVLPICSVSPCFSRAFTVT